MDVPYFIKEHLWMNVFDEATLKKDLVEVNPPQSCPWKQNSTTVVAAMMKVVNNWRSALSLNI